MIYTCNQTDKEVPSKHEDPCTSLIETSLLIIWHWEGRNKQSDLKHLEHRMDIFNGPCRSVVTFWHVTCDFSRLQRPKRTITRNFDIREEFLDCTC